MAAKEFLGINLVAGSNFQAGAGQLTAYYPWGLDSQWILHGTLSNVASGSLQLLCGLFKKDLERMASKMPRISLS